MKNVLSTANYFDSLDKTKLPGRDLVQMRLVQRENYKVIVKFPNENEIKLQLEQKEKILAEQLLSYDKIKGILNKLYIYNALPRYLDLHSLGTIQKFFEHLFIYHVSVIKKGETNAKFSLGVTPRPIGICPEKVYQFTFLKTNCFIDIIILQNKQTNIARLFIYNHIK